jgi:heptosyltransferase III
MALQMINRLKSEYVSLKFDYLVSDECQVLVSHNPLINRIHIIPKQLFKAQWNAHNCLGAQVLIESFLTELSATPYSLSLNLFQEKLGGVLQAFVVAENKVGLELIGGQTFQIRSRYLEHLAAIPASRRDNGWHAIDLYIRATRKALEAMNVNLRPQSTLAHRSWLGNNASPLPPLTRPDIAKNLAPKRFLVFHPGSAWEGKRWPESHWAALASRCFQAGLTTVFTGAPEEKPIMDRILKQLDMDVRNSLVDCVGNTSLLEAAWLLANAQLVVTGDTVAMHLAAATGTPTLSLFGPSNPVETGPYGQGHTVFQTDPNPLPDLAFSVEHQGLSLLLPEAVADYILKGTLPASISVWQTEWDPEMDMQILTDSQRARHPNWKRCLALMQILDQNNSVALALPTLESGTRYSLWMALKQAMDLPNSATFSLLESQELQLETETKDDLIWEAYRIAINGIPISDITQHFILRKARLEMALKEDWQLRNDLINPN